MRVGERWRRRVMIGLLLGGLVALGLGFLRRIGCDPLTGDLEVGEPGGSPD